MVPTVCTGGIPLTIKRKQLYKNFTEKKVANLLTNFGLGRANIYLLRGVTRQGKLWR